MPQPLLRRGEPQSLRELEVRALALVGRRVGYVATALGVPVPVESKHAKGFVGTLVEAVLGADPQAKDGPDFPKLEVELKTIPVGPDLRPRESTFCCGITMRTADREEWESSRLWRRLRRVLFVPVIVVRTQEHARRGLALAEGVFARPRLWQPTPDESAILRGDWEDLMGAIAIGRPPSAHQGRALQVRPKAQSGRERTLAAGEDGPRRALPLGFYLRADFTAAILSGDGP